MFRKRLRRFSSIIVRQNILQRNCYIFLFIYFAKLNYPEKSSHEIYQKYKRHPPLLCYTISLNEIRNFNFVFSGKRVEHLNSDINYGITLKGGLNIMGMMLQCRLSINYPHELTINASVSPLKMGGGLISLRKNSDDLETGPKLYIRITNSSVSIIRQKFGRKYMKILFFATSQFDNKKRNMYVYIRQRKSGASAG